MTLHILPLLENEHPRDVKLDGLRINDDYTFVKKIGSGTYGLIYLVEDRQGRQYAAKMVITDPPVKTSAHLDVDANKKDIQRKMYQFFTTPNQVNALDLEVVARDGTACPFLREIALHLKVHKHPNVVTIHKVFGLGRVGIMTLMDYFEQGDLFGNIIENQIFSRAPKHQDKQLLMKNCMLQMIDVVSFCASQGVYHCDLKPENVMVRYNRNHRRTHTTHETIIDYGEIQIALIDFGLAMASELICCNACRGLSFYMGPERIVNYNTNSLVRLIVNMDEFKTETHALELAAKFFPTLAGDIWLLGVLFINVTCARNPWPVANINDLHEVFANYILHNRNILSTILPILREFNHVLDDIFQLNPNDRVSLGDLYAKVVLCDFFDVVSEKSNAESNEQLCTPPYTELDFIHSPESSVTHMEQCTKGVKIFGCQNHGCGIAA